MSNDNTKNAKLVHAICTQCGGANEVDPSQEKGVCQYCNTSFFVEKAINDYTVKDARTKHLESMNSHNNKQGAVESILKFAEKQQDKKRQKIDEKNRRLEEEKRKQEEQRKRIKNQIFNKKYLKRNLIILGFVAILIIVFSIIGVTGEKPNHDGEAKPPSSSTTFEGDDYNEVIDKFEESGFVYIKTETLEDLITGWLTKDGEVESVSVDGDVDYSSYAWYPNDVEIIITYHTFPINDSENDIKKEETETTEDIKVVGEVETIEDNKPTEESQDKTKDEVTAEPIEEVNTSIELDADVEESIVVEEDYSEINQLISDRLLESQGWALGKLDENGDPTENGEPSPTHSFSLFIIDIDYLGDKLRVRVLPDFYKLNEEEKTFVINMVQGSVNAITDHIPYTTVYNFNGDRVGHSKVTNSRAFKWD